MTVGVVVVAAGMGLRLGADRPKALVEVAGEALVTHAVRRVLALAPDHVVVVHPDDHAQAFVDALAVLDGADAVRLVAGGATRAASTAAGVGALPTDTAVIAVHDAARAFQPTEVMARAVDAVVGDVVGAAPGLRVVDTLKRTTDLGVRTVDRDDLWAIQTPQAIRGDVLRTALVRGDLAGGAPTDDLGLVERAIAEGQVRGRLVVVDGDAAGLKVTTPDDLEAAERIAAGETTSDDASEGGSTVRIGSGHDVHPFSDDPGRRLVLGGIVVPGPGLAGHSDADVIAHAVIDGLLGASGRGDIGQRFGVDQPETAGASSMAMLRQVVAELSADGFRIGNVDVTVLAQKPRLAPYRDAIRLAIATDLGVASELASVKFTTTDHLGFVGRGEGIACVATVLLHGPRVASPPGV